MNMTTLNATSTPIPIPHSPFPILPNGSRRGGQSMAETAVLLAVVVVALVTFFSFIRASVSHRLKLGADTLGHGLLYGGR